MTRYPCSWLRSCVVVMFRCLITYIYSEPSMLRTILIILLFVSALPFHARVTKVTKIAYPGGKCLIYRIGLKDKQHSPYTLQNPQQFLSPRSIARRQAQHLALDSTDLPVTPAYVQAIRDKGIEVIGMSKWNNTVLVRVHTQRALRKLDGLPFIRYRMKVMTAPDSIDERRRTNYMKSLNEWSETYNNAYGATEKQIESLHGDDLHNVGFKGGGKMIAVFDGGFMNADRIPALHNIKLGGLRDFVYPPSNDIFQEMDHGTMVLSAMAVNEPGFYIGTAPEATYVLVRCEDERTENLVEEDYWAEAAEYADSLGVDIVNSSLGYHDFDDKSMSHLYIQQDGEQTLISHTASMMAGKGIVVVNSAGNDGMGTWKKINFPADAKDILTVGAVNMNGVNAPFSSIGPTADGRVKPDVMAFGSPVAVLSGRGSIISDMGTSFSSPLIAGLVACLWQALPDKTAKEIIDLVRSSGNRSLNPDNIYGYGIPDFWLAYQKGRQK